MTIIENGKTDYKILISHNAGADILHAAQMLRDFAEKATGGRFQIWRDTYLKRLNGEDDWTPIPARAWRGEWGDRLIPSKFISLGETKLFASQNFEDCRDELNGDGFWLRTQGGHVFISAKCGRGILYGVCEILERFFGIRFLTERETYIPRRKKITIPDCCEKHVPAFAMRAYLVGGVFQDTADPEHYVHTRTSDNFTQMDAAHGGRSPMWGRNVDHNFHFYVPEEVYGESHPEFYYHDKTFGTTVDLLNGITADGKLDKSKDVSVAKIVIEEMKKDIVANPDIDFFVFEQEDGWFFYPYTNPDDVATEKKYGRTGILIRFCNVLAEELQKWADAELGGRKINIVTFAYSYTSDAPVMEKNGRCVPIDETVIARENVVIRMALMSNAYYTYFDSRQEDYIKDALAQWSLCAKHFMFWAYDNNFTRYLYYFPSFHTIGENVRGFRDMGITYLSMQGPHNTCASWQGNMRAYVYRNLMWNPDRDADALLHEYLELYYGIASPFVREMMDIFDAWYKKVSEEKLLDVRMVVGNHFKPEYNDIKVIDAAEDAIRRGEEKVRKSRLSAAEKEKLLRKLQCVKATPQFMRYNDYLDYYPDRTEKDRDICGEEFFETCRKANVDFFAETMMFEEYVIEKKL